MRSLSKENFLERANTKHKNKFSYKLPDKFNLTSEIEVQCPIHGWMTQKAYLHIESITGCRHCFFQQLSNDRSINTEEYLYRVRKVHGDKYDYSRLRYNRSSDKIEIGCKIHGFFTQTANNHIKGQGCPSCHMEQIGKWNRSNTDLFIKKAKAVHGDRYDYSEVKYETDNSKVGIKCSKHGVFYQAPNPHLQGQGCPSCKASRGEKTLALIFEEEGIDFIAEYTIPNSGTRFKYDFYLPKHQVLVEFHGIQHYQPVEMFGGNEGFLTRKTSDSIKESLAKTFNLGLLIIHYKLLNLDYDKFKEIVIKQIDRKTKNTSIKLLPT